VLDLVLVLRYRKAVTYGFHVLLVGLKTHAAAVTYQVRHWKRQRDHAARLAAAAEAHPRPGRSRTLHTIDRGPA
jgi:hypothetical protein